MEVIMKGKKEPVSLTEMEKKQIGRLVGERFEQLVLKKFKTHRSFLVATGVPERLFFRFKEGGNSTLQTILLFSKALGVHPKELFDIDLSSEIIQRRDFDSWPDYYDYLRTKKELRK
jgi:hypothetical protein